jgi:hypothetical protein
VAAPSRPRKNGRGERRRPVSAHEAATAAKIAAAASNGKALPARPASTPGGSAYTGEKRKRARKRRKRAAAVPVRARRPRMRDTGRF